MESDDVWDDDDGSQQKELDREWEARRQQYYNVSDRDSCISSNSSLLAAESHHCVQAGYRDGVEEGKTATVQLGFNIGEHVCDTN
jgi:hypothetical protein